MSLMNKLQGTEAIEQGKAEQQAKLEYTISFIIRNIIMYENSVVAVAYRIRFRPKSIEEDSKELEAVIAESVANRKAKAEPKPWWKFWK